MNIKKAIPILDWLPSYRRSFIAGDLSAGLTVGVMLIPQGMAYALIAGLPPVYGLYASIVPQLIYALLGTSRQLSVGPVAMDSLMVAAGVGVLAIEGTDAYIHYAILVALVMGAFQLAFGVLRLGFITNLLARPVVTGFTAAAALIIGINQLKYLMGTDLGGDSNPFKLLMAAANKLEQIHWLTLILGVGGVGLIVLFKRINGRIPGALIAIIAGVGLVTVFDLDQLGVSIVRDIPSGFPGFKLPIFSLEQLRQVAPLAVTISVVAFMEAFSVGRALEAKQKNYKLRPNQELVALGAANVAGALFQSFPVTGGFSRSAVNQQSGANTPLAAIVAAVIVALTLLFLTPLFYALPHALLASVILVAVSGLVDLSYIRELYRINKKEFVLLIGTFGITLLFGMVEGIVSGIILSILLLLYQQAYPHIARLGRIPGHHDFRNVRRFKGLEEWDNLLILRPDASISFINIQYLREFVETQIRQSKGKIETVILDFAAVSHVDATAMQGLRDLVGELREKNVTLFLSDVIGPVRDRLHSSGLNELIGRNHIFLDVDEAVRGALSHQDSAYSKIALQTGEISGKDQK